MDDKLFNAIHERHVPKFNEVVCNGLAIEQMRNCEGYIDRIIRCAEISFPAGFKYEGYQRCGHHEEYQEVTRKRNSKRTYEMAVSYVYLVKFMFSFNGEMLPKPCYLYLPYVDDAGLIKLRGSTFSISPVLADLAISVGVDNLFIPLTKDKLTFERVNQFIYAGSERVMIPVVWSTIYHRDTRKSSFQVNTTLMHYLLCKYGLKQTFAQYAGADVEVGYEDTINETNYPEADWVICRSIRIKPRGIREKWYTGSNIRLAIRRSQYTQLAINMIGGFFYIVDHYPDRVKAEAINQAEIGDNGESTELTLWKILLGIVIFGETNHGKLQENVRLHMESLDDYIDEMVRENLRKEDVYVENIYDLFAHIIDTHADRIRQAGNGVSSMYGKRLLVERFVLSNIIRAINTFMFKLRAANRRQLTRNDITNTMSRILKTDLIIGINANHGEVASISSPGDNKIFKITSQVVLQTSSSGGNTGRSKSNLVSPSKHLHASIAEVGSYSNLPKSDPTGRSRLNPCVRLEADGLIKRDPEKRELIDKVQAMIQR